MRILVIDDMPDTHTQLSEMLPPVGIDIHVAANLSTGLSLFKAYSFEAVLIDLRLEPQKNDKTDSEIMYSGIQLGAQIRSLANGVLIVMYSGAIDENKEKEFKYYQRCIDSGADHIVSKIWLTSTPPVEIKNKLIEWVSRKNVIIPKSHLEIDNSIDSKATLERLGGINILEQIIQNLLPPMIEHKIATISGGYSGAMVLFVESFSEKGGIAEMKNVIKISDSDKTLQEELSGRPFSGSSLDINSMVSNATKPFRWDKWFAFITPQVRDSQSLQAYLLTCKNYKSIQQTIDQIVSDLIIGPAQCSVDPKSITNPTLKIKFTFLAEIKAQLKELSDYAYTINNIRKEINILDKYIDGLADGYYPLVNSNIKVARLHGDFHCRNILIKKSGTPVIIDYGRGDIYPRLFDAACLDVDSMISVVDNFKGHCWDMNKLDEWVEMINNSYPFKTVEISNNCAVTLLRKSIHIALNNNIPFITKEEYSQLLLFHILRYSRVPSSQLRYFVF